MLSLYPIDRLKLFLTPSSQITPHWHQKVTWSTRYSRRNVHRNLKKPSANLTFTWFRQPSIMSMYKNTPSAHSKSTLFSSSAPLLPTIPWLNAISWFLMQLWHSTCLIYLSSTHLYQHMHVFGNHDYNHAPIATPGTKFVAHTTPKLLHLHHTGELAGTAAHHPNTSAATKFNLQTQWYGMMLLKLTYSRKIPSSTVTPSDYLKQTASGMLPYPKTPNIATIIPFSLDHQYIMLFNKLPSSLAVPLTPNKLSAPQSTIPQSHLQWFMLNLIQCCYYCSMLHIPLTPTQKPRAKCLIQSAITIDSFLTGPDSHIWIKSPASKIGRSVGLSKSRKSLDPIAGNNTFFFIKPSNLPTYCIFVWNLW